MTEQHDKIVKHIENLILNSDSYDAISTLTRSLVSLSELELRWFEYIDYSEKE